MRISTMTKHFLLVLVIVTRNRPCTARSRLRL